MLKTIELAVMIGVSAFLTATVANEYLPVIAERIALVAQALQHIQALH